MVTTLKEMPRLCLGRGISDYLFVNSRDRAEGGAGGALAPPLFYKNKNILNKT